MKLEQQKQKVNFDRKCKILKPIKINRNVRYQDKLKSKCQFEKVIDKPRKRSYIYFAETWWFIDHMKS